MSALSQLNIIQVNGLSKVVSTFEGELPILSDISFNVKHGESVAVVGTSGSGKSTLLSLLAGLDTASGGEIFLDGEPLHNLDEEARAGLRAAKVGFVFQSFMLVQSLTALENVMLPAELAGERDAKQQALILLEKVGLGHRIDHYPSQLSGGEQQRVAIARAFIGTPKILFADEPSANLDSKNGKMIESLLFDLNSQHGTTLILVTHDEALAQKCQHIIQIEGGRLVENSAEEIANVG
ncbi:MULTISPECIES: ABC transporter ATP-binding protein [Pseudoalteromonas]|jgi:putative ABC transport system ATP-binding protein|uniref:Lipoprotein releasing system ATP-binding component of ABC transporter n=2 Tax=Pseudoalteromonas TaxID=53246 RepID=Q3III8_PSET1|nr:MULTISPECIES: ABC transporter ATP-binding protein [Pseudoalteromonas]ASM54546.1 putative ABC transport system ATP-binding protein [Pseudoalteromonas nigrifaciens]MBB1371442.1 ABC transporter ATP-binding protein [Pseudoalteromonas sp. SR45-4]MBB1404473.1 ABC transporter ATP-binding protein [Pseudoalteromonas sp. SG44-5]MBE0421750.1 ABC transporter ATP-binding protein [Pseudoalteromonas nigrifaciens]MBH0073679.1 ABC transporter ATP-binding protein [Pseudoalteromonas sp. NZS127]|tara:strand:- start:10900 stop:11613 length:714 start_codon:yes stop_codon:yes gene_type:complete